jgi:iron complex transport system permease protein
MSAGRPFPARIWLPALAVLSLLAILLALSFGSAVRLSPYELLATLLGDGTPSTSRIIFDLRLPRILSAFVTGGLLALAGSLMQVLLRNPLADPYILGISGGAAVAALLAMLAGVSGLLLSGSAFSGALVSMLLVFGLAHGTGSWSPTRLLLTGVVIATGWGALISFILAISPTENLPGMLFWLMGDLSQAWHYGYPLAVLVVALLLCLPMARSLNLMTRGDLHAAALGVPVARYRWQLYLLGSLLTATAVTVGGSIGFIGLVVPHILRLAGCTDHRLLLPASVLLGGTLLVLADILARTLIAPTQLPVGILTALIGVPLFLLLLYRSRQ